MRGKRRVGAVIPAAGLSSRMGRFKPLLPFGDGTVIEATVSRALSAVDVAVVVLGKRCDELYGLLSERFGDRLIFAYNENFAETDMLTSVRLGAEKLGEVDAFFLVPADMPMIGDGTYEALLTAFDGDSEVVIPVVGGRRAHPPLISGALIGEITSFDGDGGLKAIFSRHKVREIAVPDDGALVDLDTEQDYNRAVKTGDG